MTLKLTDLIVSPSRGSIDEAMAYAKRQGAKRQPFLLDYLTELWRLCKSNGFDFSILVAQSDNETDSWRSAIWQQYGNPAGLAVTNSQNLSVVYQSGADAARAHVVHMWAYRYGRVPKGSELAAYTVLDGHYEAVFTTNDTRGNPLAGSVRTVGDFNVNGRWALLDRQNTPTGPLDDYGNRIVQNGRAVWPNLPDQDPPVTTPATDPEPVPGEQENQMTDPLDLIRDYLIEAPVAKTADGYGFNYGARNIVGLAEHETQGLMNGPDRQKFFSCPSGERCKNALVDFNIQPNGKIYRYQDPFTTNRIPWASGGDAAAITQVARKAVAQMGNPYGGVNAFYAAVEIEKEHGAAMTPAQIESTARLLAYICAMNGYPVDDWKYPDVLKNNVPTSVNHSDLYTSTNCRINDDDRAKFEARCTELLKTFYAGATPVEPSQPTTPTTPAPVVEIIPGLDYAVAARLFGTAKGEDGVTYKFDKNGPVSKLWLANGRATGEWPALAQVLSYEGGKRRYFIFAGGWTVIAVSGQEPQQLRDAA